MRKQKIISNPKVAPPRLQRVLLRKRLFSLIDSNRAKPVIWLSAPAGSGKTTLVASYLQSRNLPCLWYQIDKGDGDDIANFFYYMGIAAQSALPKKQKPLPLLTPEYLQDIATFTKRYFEKLYSRLNPSVSPLAKGGIKGGGGLGRIKKGGFVIVFDNYQDATLTSPLHEAIAEGLNMVPDGINVFILSRSEPLQSLSRLRANSSLAHIRWNDIRFTFEESKDVIHMKEGKALPDELLEKIYKKTEGWIAGLILALENLKIRDIDTNTLERVASDEIFDYFASEIFSRTAPEVQQFLLKTAFLPKMTLTTVERLTGIEGAGQILSYLNKNQFFIKNHFLEEPVYEYHQLFREFLLARAKRIFASDELSLIQRKAADMLKETGNAEDAAGLLCDMQDWDGLIELVLSHAQSLIKQGRTKTLEAWINAVPDKIFHNQPWLMFYKGACLFSSNPRDARQFFESSFNLFKEQNERMGIFFSWSGIMDTYFHECEFASMDDCVDMLDEVIKQDNSFPSPEIEEHTSMYKFMGLALNRSQHPDIAGLEERALAFIQRNQDMHLCLQTGICLLVYNAWMGNFKRAGFVEDILRGWSRSKDCSDLMFTTVKDTEAFYAFFTGSSEGSREIISDALQRSEQSGVHVWDTQIYLQWLGIALNEGDMKTADELLQKMQTRMNNARRFDIGFYNYLLAWNAFLNGDILGAFERQKTSVEILKSTGFTLCYSVMYINLALIMHEEGDDKEAEANLSKAYELADFIKSRFSRFNCLLIEAYIAHDKKEEERALNCLRTALPIGREHGYMNIQWWIPRIMSILCAKTLEHNIEKEYVHSIIRKRNIMPVEQSLYLDNWPYPLMIYTLGRFEIIKGSKRVEPAGRKQQKRPMDLLKMIIAMGSEEVRDEEIMDILWPDTEGDSAWRAFATTLHRLRKLIGNDKAILWRDGIVTIDRQYCYIDALGFQELVKRADEALYQGSQKQAAFLLEKAVSLYKGHFLAKEDKLPPAILLRERLKGRFTQYIGKLGQLYEAMGEFDKAIDAYNRGIAVDELDEKLYHCLMLCYKKMGLKSEAAKAYNRFKAALFQSLQLEPSAEIQAVYKTLLS